MTVCARLISSLQNSCPFCVSVNRYSCEALVSVLIQNGHSFCKHYLTMQKYKTTRRFTSVMKFFIHYLPFDEHPGWSV